METVEPYRNLTVTVLHGKSHHSQDILTESDYYVTIRLPTASARTHRTKTVSNNNRPEWNESFHFRVHSGVKNILELKVYDEDMILQDDLCSTILFDICNLTLGKKETKKFTTNDETKDELWVELEIVESSETPQNYLSNGVLVAAPLSTLEVKVEKLLTNAVHDNLIVKLRGAYKEDQLVTRLEPSSSIMRTLRYYINRDLETEIGLTVLKPQQHVIIYLFQLYVLQAEALTSSSLPIKPLPAPQEAKISLTLGEDTLDLCLRTEDCSSEDLDVRLDFGISTQEKEFLKKRRLVVAQALQEVLNLKTAPKPRKVPVVAVVCTGGGTRAMTGFLGSLKGLQNLGLLDTISYITGVSGSTWAMSCLYDDADWSKTGLDTVMAMLKGEISKSVYSLFSFDQLSYYRDELKQRENDGHVVSLIDMWGLAIEHLIHGKRHLSTLSDQQRAVSKGQNPLPIYTAVNIKKGMKGITKEAEWCEFNPYEVGFPKYGAFVPAQNFGSEYYLGRLIKKIPETRLSFLMGIWSSFFSASLTELWTTATGLSPSWMPWIGEDVNNIETDNKPSTLDTYLIKPVTDTVRKLAGFLTSRPVTTQMYNFLRGLYLHINYSEHSTFTTWKDTHPDAFPNLLTPADSTLALVDAGLACNAGFPPVLRSERQVDIILSLNYSWDNDQFLVLKQTQDYCADHRVPFPRIDFRKVESEPLKEMYVFEDKENPKAPVVLHFPLVNVSFREFKSPGVKRRKQEPTEGEVDLNSNFSPYATQNLTYTPEEFQNLVDLTSYNIVNNKDTILETLRRALHKHRSESDCYVILKLPTASARTHRTKTVSNSNRPEWNESFHFRVQSHVKNILELQVYDEDILRDDHCSTILFDISNLIPGKKETKVFILDPETKDQLWVEFEIVVSPEAPGLYLSNGVLVVAPFSALEVKVDQQLVTAFHDNLIVKLRGAYKEDQLVTRLEPSSSIMRTLRYYINRDLETEIGLGDTVDLHLKTEDWEELEVRLDFGLPVQEKEFLEKRRVVCAQAFQKVLNLKSPPQPHKVPSVAMVCSGGGTRAMTGLFGHLKGLKALGLLDTVCYITGVSGSTWAMSCLYDNADWSKTGLDTVMAMLKGEISKSVYSLFSFDQLSYYRDELKQRENDGHVVSLIDMWGLAIEHLIHGKKHCGTLSDQQRALSNGQNPLPIYTAVNMKSGIQGSTMEAEWCEFTPYEVGFPKYGAFVPVENFGSEYYLGRMVKKLPETRVSLLIGLWSSVFSLNLTQLWSFVTGTVPTWIPWIGENVDHVETNNKPSTLDTYFIKPVADMTKMLTSFLTNRPVISQMYNFLRGLYLHWNYSEHSTFTAWKNTHPDAFPNLLTPADSTLALVDAGFACNAGFPPVLRSERQVDIILSLNYSWDNDQFLVLKQTQDYCADHRVPFPRIDFRKVESEPLKEMYVFEDKENPKVPVVLHFPLVNVSFREFKSPGVKRKKQELKGGEVDVSSPNSPYLTENITYSQEVFQNLVDLTSYNIQNNKATILKTLHKALERKAK
ncbi:cytosolic phospholipase A2 zeta [Chanos chanos]|uniref:Phospholipase A2 n=1 Tax=Chanos chanos TaxID=29144 RepID=A0A6J2WG36_CHACN|nr:cytosolic phospholipase A2 zeta-like [Chanos chanos]